MLRLSSSFRAAVFFFVFVVVLVELLEKGSRALLERALFMERALAERALSRSLEVAVLLELVHDHGLVETVLESVFCFLDHSKLFVLDPPLHKHFRSLFLRCLARVARLQVHDSVLSRFGVVV